MKGWELLITENDPSEKVVKKDTETGQSVMCCLGKQASSSRAGRLNRHKKEKQGTKVGMEYIFARKLWNISERSVSVSREIR